MTIKDYTTDQPGEGEQTWTTDEMTRDFEVKGFSAPYVVVIRKSDRQLGSLQFTHNPRVYFNFQPTSARPS
jgi:hypothetical protein